MTVRDAQVKVGKARHFRWVLVAVVVLCCATLPVSLMVSFSALVKAGDAQTRVIAITRSACSLARQNPHDRVAQKRCDRNISDFVKSLGPQATEALAEKVKPFLRR